MLQMTNMTLASLLSSLLFLQELLTEVDNKDDSKTVGQKLWRWMVHALAWAICVGSTTASVFAIYYFSEYMHQVRRGDDFSFRFLGLPETLKQASGMTPLELTASKK